MMSAETEKLSPYGQKIASSNPDDALTIHDQESSGKIGSQDGRGKLSHWDKNLRNE